MSVLAFLAVLALAGPQERVDGPNAISLPSQNPLITEGDLHYSRRQDGRVGALANPREIAQAVAAYDRASEAPDTAEARWKLARALYFQAAYTGQDAEAQRAIYEKAKRVGDEAIAILERRAKGRGAQPFAGRPPADVAAAVMTDRDALPSFFWTAVAWGQWALVSGKMKAAKTGAAEKIRDDASVVIALDPEFEDAGGYRVLGRLHHQAPKIPFLTFWVSREKALENLRRSVALNERNFVNRHFLADALADGGPDERAEAVRIEEGVVADSPSPGHLVEDLSIQILAKRNLEKWKK